MIRADDRKTQDKAATVDTDANQMGATWRDVAIVVVEFAREDSMKFVLVFAAVCLGLWFLFPRVTSALRARYQDALAKLRKDGTDEEMPND